jgi:catechol 2,3-dioxygenase-like lactoylglutathione lyase family enzyme
MVAFYTEAFGARFRRVDTNGFLSQFGEIGGITVKLVPIREEADFENFPVHQLGFTVSNLDSVIALAIKYGGRQEGRISREDERIHGAIRDPDGNTIELYEQKKVP